MCSKIRFCAISLLGSMFVMLVLPFTSHVACNFPLNVFKLHDKSFLHTHTDTQTHTAFQSSAGHWELSTEWFTPKKTPRSDPMVQTLFSDKSNMWAPAPSTMGGPHSELLGPLLLVLEPRTRGSLFASVLQVAWRQTTSGCCSYLIARKLRVYVRNHLRVVKQERSVSASDALHEHSSPGSPLWDLPPPGGEPSPPRPPSLVPCTPPGPHCRPESRRGAKWSSGGVRTDSGEVGARTGTGTEFSPPLDPVRTAACNKGAPVGSFCRSRGVLILNSDVRSHHSQGAGGALHRERGELHAQGHAQEPEAGAAAPGLLRVSG